MNIVIIIFLILTLLNGVLYHTLELTVRGYIAIISDRGYRLEVVFFFFFKEMSNTCTDVLISDQSFKSVYRTLFPSKLFHNDNKIFKDDSSASY